MTSLAIFFTLICVVQLLIIILIRKPHKLMKAHNVSKAKTRPVKIFLLIFMVILYILFFIALGNYHKPQPMPEGKYQTKTIYPTLTPNLVQPLGGRLSGSISNLYFLYLGSDKSQATMTTVAFGLRQEYCKNLCIINIYDDKTAFERDIERVTIASDAKMRDWNKQNYVYVADHYLGYLDAVQDAAFNYYPFHDGYYKHAKAGTLDQY